jgi:TetR/AcrR family transcriptional repressor of nem operon
VGRTSDAKERLIETARELMHDKGYGAVGVGEICAKAGVNKGSFYYFFESKQLLGIAALDAYWAEVREQWLGILRGAGDPFERIDKLMQSSYRTTREAKKTCGHVTGCMLGNLALEQSTQDPEVQNRLREIFDEQQALFAEVLSEAADAGKLAQGTTPKSGARSILAYIEGMVMLAKLHDDPNVLRGMGAQVRRLVAA